MSTLCLATATRLGLAGPALASRRPTQPLHSISGPPQHLNAASRARPAAGGTNDGSLDHGSRAETPPPPPATSSGSSTSSSDADFEAVMAGFCYLDRRVATGKKVLAKAAKLISKCAEVQPEYIAWRLEHTLAWQITCDTDAYRGSPYKAMPARVLKAAAASSSFSRSLLQEAILAARLQHLLRISLPNFFRAHAVLKADLQAFKAELKASKASALASKTSWDANKASLDRLRSRMYRLDKRLERLREKAPRLEKDVVRTGCNLARMVAKREGGSEGVVQPQHPDLAERSSARRGAAGGTHGGSLKGTSRNRTSSPQPANLNGSSSSQDTDLGAIKACVSHLERRVKKFQQGVKQLTQQSSEYVVFMEAFLAQILQRVPAWRGAPGGRRNKTRPSRRATRGGGSSTSAQDARIASELQQFLRAIMATKADLEARKNQSEDKLQAFQADLAPGKFSRQARGTSLEALNASLDLLESDLDRSESELERDRRMAKFSEEEGLLMAAELSDFAAKRQDGAEGDDTPLP
ncbi:hypothetical protein D9Q98_009603 [Chlorella vulgaris]|uniref:Uncharacterized protein n=1 Tax=Chlorella vulgaris TaxID=3077 RepID=A0A9D4TFI7_CHLVU|nr:hypothetical protein D9Q98_009603 [Chlorella vulgaris]